jgi:hypothetical protein
MSAGAVMRTCLPLGNVTSLPISTVFVGFAMASHA